VYTNSSDLATSDEAPSQPSDHLSCPLLLVVAHNILNNTAFGRFILLCHINPRRFFLQSPMTCPQLKSIRPESFFLDQLTNLSADPSSSSLVYLLPPCLIFLAIDVAVRLSYRASPTTVPTEDEADLDEEVIDRLSHRAHKVLSDFSRLEANISAEMIRSQRFCRTLEKCRNFSHHRYRLEAYNARHGSQAHKTSCIDSHKGPLASPSRPFASVSCFRIRSGVSRNKSKLCKDRSIQRNRQIRRVPSKLSAIDSCSQIRYGSCKRRLND
jgi:hypothetical protein